MSGIPMTYDDDSLYIDDKAIHSLVIGTTGSGKTQAILLPQARLAIKAGESIVVNDVKGEIYESLKDDLGEKRRLEQREAFSKMIHWPTVSVRKHWTRW